MAHTGGDREWGERRLCLIDNYKRRARDADEMFEKPVQFANKLNEAARKFAENLPEEELAIFDLLMKSRVDLTEEEIEQVEEVARSS